MKEQTSIQARPKQSLRQRLLLFIIGVSATALLLSAGSIVWIEAHAIRAQRITDLDILATTIANNSAAALAFNDQAAAHEAVRAIAMDDDIVSAVIIDKAGKQFTHYTRDVPESHSYWEPFAPIQRSTNILLKQEFLGRLDLVSTSGKLKLRMLQFLRWIAIVTAAGILAVILLALRFGATILAPIMRLVEVAGQVSSTANYSLRAANTTADEVGLLVDSFNSMLSEIGKRDDELAAERQQLERRVAERTQELVVAKDLAEAANRAKGQFLANMSHELRTPLNAVIGYADLLASRDDVSGEVREQLLTIHSSGNLLLALINDILDLSKIDSNKMVLESIPCDLAQLLKSIPPLFTPIAQEKGVALNTNIDPCLPQWIKADPTRLRQVLLNLVGNAVKFTAHGSVNLNAQTVLQNGTTVQICFKVTDSGIGIPKEKLAVIFHAFDQADGSTTRRFGGTGLGLSIASRLVQLMGSKIIVSSEEGKGSEFSFTIEFPLSFETVRTPLAKADTAQRSEQSSAYSSANTTVLVAEDNSVNTRLVTTILKRHGYNVVCARDGIEAIEKFGAASIQIILMDLQMPRMGGIEASRNIRATSKGAKVPIIALTAHAFHEIKEECLQAGINTHLAKPIDARQLISTIDGLLSNAPLK